MFVGAGVGGVWNRSEEVDWFYEGYDPYRADPVALAYYRNERIVADLAEYARRILGEQDSPEDREMCLRQLESQFDPGSVIDIARASDPGAL